MKVVLLPFPAFGHMMPFYQLALALAKAGVQVSYLSTPRNIERLPKVPLNLSPFLDLIPIPFPKNTPLPEGAEATIDIPPEMMGGLFMACDLLQQPVDQFLADNSPDWLVVDFLYHWAADIAPQRGVSLLCFSVLTAAANVYMGPPGKSAEVTKFQSSLENLTKTPPWVTFPSKVVYRRFEAIPYMARLKEASEFERVLKLYGASKAIVFRSCREIEGEYLTLLADLLNKPVIPMGLIPPELPKQSEFADEIWNETFRWLDNQKPKSVVFVGFGSECKLTKEQVVEIANGLEESDLPFIWSLRKPAWAAEELDALPTGFVDRTRGKGKVCFGWAPQLEILAHPAVSVSFFHSGWGSVIEALQFGHALVALPLIFDQGLNARLLVEKGLAIEVERNEDDGTFKGKDIAKCLKQAMSTVDGSARVKEAKMAVKDRNLHERYMDEFVKYLQENKVKVSSK